MQKLANQKITEYLDKNFDIDEGEVENPAKNNMNKFDYVTHKLQELKATIYRFISVSTDINRLKLNNQKKISAILSRFLNEHKILPQEMNSDCGSRIFLDVTYSINVKSMTGIPRVVTEIVTHSFPINVIPVVIIDDQFYYLSKNNVLTPINLKCGDIFIHADAGWNYSNELSHALSEVSRNGGINIVLLYDLIPIQYPQLSNQNHVSAFSSWLNIIFSQSDHILCISKSVADEIVYMLSCINTPTHGLKSIGWSHLGCDFTVKSTSNSEMKIDNFPLFKAPYFLSVGTMEPRKAYSVAIDAMNSLWERGGDASYVIVGKYGWSQSKIKQTILNHREYGKRLFWFQNASDYELQCLYGNALALVSTSLCEGFGLPLIEAAHHNLSSIVSDIPVYREIGGKSTSYFEVTNSNELADLLIEALTCPKKTPDLEFLTWKNSVKNMLTMIVDNKFQYNNF
jgi:glycosyltransferase involved in cell wall biosynthesis